jgi:hypothetical protein
LRLDLRLEWLTLLPVCPSLPVMKQRRATLNTSLTVIKVPP